MDDEIGVNPPDHPVWDNSFLVNLLFLAPTIFPLWMFVRGALRSSVADSRQLWC